MNLEFRPANKVNFRVLSRLSRTLTPEQQMFVAHNAYSMLEALYEPEGNYPIGIYDGDEAVGFILYGFDGNEWWIIRFMIGGQHQRKGYGRAAMLKLIDVMRNQHGAGDIKISFVPTNTAARTLYASVGFEDTGTIEEGEVVYILKRPQATGNA